LSWAHLAEARADAALDPPIVEPGPILDIDASFGFCVHGPFHFGAAAFLTFQYVLSTAGNCNCPGATPLAGLHFVPKSDGASPWQEAKSTPRKWRECFIRQTQTY
jgi:hypothetical protein